MKTLLGLGLLSLLIFTGCSNKQVKVVDENGKAVQGALVISEQQKYIMQSWKLSAHFTDKEGKADVVSDRGYVFSKAHHILVDNYLKETIKLYSLGHKKTIGIKEKTITLIDDLDNRKKTQRVPLSICKDSTVSFSPSNATFIVNSKTKSLIPSTKFYFEKGNASDKHSQLISTYGRLAFYCQNKNKFNKIYLKFLGIRPILSERRKLLMPIHVSSLENTSLDTYIEPSVIEPMNKDTFYIRSLSKKNKPSISADKNINEKLKNFNKELPEGNEHTQALFDYVLRAVELDK